MRLVTGLSLTEANYKEALEILEQRYGNKQTIVNSHMSELVSFSPVKSINATRRLRELYGKVETNLRSLDAWLLTGANIKDKVSARVEFDNQ